MNQTQHLGRIVLLSLDGTLVQCLSKGVLVDKDNWNLDINDYRPVESLTHTTLINQGAISRYRLGFVLSDYPYSAIPIINNFVVSLVFYSPHEVYYIGQIFEWDGYTNRESKLPEFNKKTLGKIIGKVHKADKSKNYENQGQLIRVQNLDISREKSRPVRVNR